MTITLRATHPHRAELLLPTGFVPTTHHASTDMEWFLLIPAQTLRLLISMGVLPATPGQDICGIDDHIVDAVEAARAYVIWHRGLKKGADETTLRERILSPGSDSQVLVDLVGQFAVGTALTCLHHTTFTLRPLPRFVLAKRLPSGWKATKKLFSYAKGRGKD